MTDEEEDDFRFYPHLRPRVAYPTVVATPLWMALVTEKTQPESIPWYTWRAWRRGRRTPWLTKLPEYAKAFGMSDMDMIRAMGWQDLPHSGNLTTFVEKCAREKTRTRNLESNVRRLAKGETSAERSSLSRARWAQVAQNQALGLSVPTLPSGRIDIKRVTLPPRVNKTPQDMDRDDEEMTAELTRKHLDAKRLALLDPSAPSRYADDGEHGPD